MKRYQCGQAAFAVLKDALETDADLRDDVEKAFDLLLSRYNTRIYENRFLVGGVAERIIAAAFAALGHEATKTGVKVTRTDLKVLDSDLSVKGAFKPKTRDIRLINTMGNTSKPIWDEPTIFIASGLGIGYADPTLLPEKTRKLKDALVIRFSELCEFWESSPSHFVGMNIPFSRVDIEGSDVASRAVADEIFRYKMKKLQPFDKRTPLD